MNVKQLMDLLAQEDPEATVHFAYPSGDYWRTVLCPEVTEVDEGCIRHDAYHDEFKLMPEDNASDEDTLVVVIS